MLKRVHSIIFLTALVVLLTACSGKTSTITPEPAHQAAAGSAANAGAPSTQKEDAETTASAEEQKESEPEASIKKIDMPWEATNYMSEGLIGYLDPATKLWGYCDYDGKVVIPAQYAYISPFKDGHAAIRMIRTDPKEQIIDTSGKIICDAADVRDPNLMPDGTANHVKTTEFNNVTNGLIFDMTEKYGFYMISDFGAATIKNSDFKDILKVSQLQEILPGYDGIGIGLSDDYISLTGLDYFKWNNGTFDKVTTVLLDYDLNVVIPPDKYSYIIPLDSEHLWVANYDRTFGLIDKAGKTLIEMSGKQICPLLPEEDINHIHGDGVLAFELKTIPGTSAESNIELLYNYQVVNCSGKNYVLIIDVKDEHNNASAEIYDLDQEKVVGVIPDFSVAASAHPVFLLPGVVLHTDPENPFQCFDYKGNVISNGDFLEKYYAIDKVSTDGNTAVLALELGYMQGELKDYCQMDYAYIRVTQK